MLKQWLGRCRRLFGIAAVEEVEPVPEDAWELMFYLARHLKEVALTPITILHYDYLLEVFSQNADELFSRVEMMISCIENESDVSIEWDERGRTRYYEPIPDFYFSVKFGYRHPQQILLMVIEKVEVIHYLLESKQLNQNHPYYHYMRREFYSVISDVNSVLQTSVKLPKVE